MTARTSRAASGILALCGAGLALTACGDSTGVSQGSLSILLTDAPGDFHQAIVTIDRIELAGQGDSEDGPGTVLTDTPVTTDLLTLSNDVITLVEDFTLPTGTYAQLRFIISEACIVVEGEGEETSTYASSGFDECGPADGPLQMPSFSQTGIKVNLPGGAVSITGEQKILVIDFDVSESFGHVAGGSGMWVMSPVLRATDLGLTASIAITASLADGVTLPDVGGPVTLADFVVEAEDSGGGSEGSVPLTDGDGDGVFEATLQFLDPAEGPFSIWLANADVDVVTDPPTPVSVPVSSGAESSQALEITSAEASGG